MVNGLKAGSELFNLAIHRDGRFDFWELLNGRKVFSFSPKVIIDIIYLVTDIPEETFTELTDHFRQSVKTFQGLSSDSQNAEDSMRTSLEAFLSTTEEANRNMQNLGL